MSRPGDPDEIELHGADVARRYRQLPVDGVPADLDELVLQHARAAVTEPAATRRRKSWSRWAVPFACAASTLVAFAVMYEAPRTRESSAPPTLTAPRVTPQASAPPAVSSKPAAIPPAPVPTATARSASNRPANPPAPPVQLDEVIVTGSYIRGSTEDAAVPVDVITAEELEARSSPTDVFKNIPAIQPAPATDTPTTDPVELEVNPALEKDAALEARLDRIRELRSSGRRREADRAWRRFRDKYPNYPVAADDLARPQ